VLDVVFGFLLFLFSMNVCAFSEIVFEFVSFKSTINDAFFLRMYNFFLFSRNKKKRVLVITDDVEMKVTKSRVK
jgi:hypothetical protein